MSLGCGVETRSDLLLAAQPRLVIFLLTHPFAMWLYSTYRYNTPYSGG